MLRDAHLYNSIHRAGLLAKATIDAFGHVYVITRCSPAAIGTRFCLNCDRLRERKIWGLPCAFYFYYYSSNSHVQIIKPAYNYCLSLQCQCILEWTRAIRKKVYLGRTNGLTEFTGNAPLLSRGVPAQHMFPTETGRQRALLEGVVDCGRFTEKIAHGHSQTCIKTNISWCLLLELFVWWLYGSALVKDKSLMLLLTSEQLCPQKCLSRTVRDGLHICGFLLIIDILCI